MASRSPRNDAAASRPERLPAPEEVRAFLARNPAFLAEHPELFERLVTPKAHAGENVADMRQFMLRRLQGEVERLKDERRELVSAGRAHLAAQARIHQAVEQMLEAANFEHLIHIVTRDMAQTLDVDVITLAIEAADEQAPRRARTPGVYVLEPGALEALLGPDADVLLLGATRGDPALFGPAANLVRSQALVRVSASPRTPDGLIAFGSRAADRFEAGQSTELVQFLARVLGRLIRGWLHLPA